MNEIDDAILEFFAEQNESIALPPTAVWYNLSEVERVIEKSRDTVARRMRKLPKRGLLERVDDKRGYYRLTQKGRDYLAGELDAQDVKLEDEIE